MGKPYSIDLRDRVQAEVASGNHGVLRRDATMSVQALP